MLLLWSVISEVTCVPTHVVGQGVAPLPCGIIEVTMHDIAQVVTLVIVDFITYFVLWLCLFHYAPVLYALQANAYPN